MVEMFDKKQHNAAEPRSNEDSDSFGDTISLGSKQSSVSTTFRDTEMEEDLASSIMWMQSLTSIVNDPRADGFVKYVFAHSHSIQVASTLDWKWESFGIQTTERELSP